MFNIKVPNINSCQNGRTIYHGEYSYIFTAKWKDFIRNAQNNIERAITLKNIIDDYDISKEV
jgi:hypothetical protein